MSYKNILVAFNDTESSASALRCAMLMHERWGCHVTGVHAYCNQFEKLREQEWVPESMRRLIATQVEDGEGRLRDSFLAAVAERIPPEMCHWISQQGQPDAMIADYARMFDMTVVGRHDTLHSGELALHPDRIALKSGRGVLVVPRTWHAEHIPEHAVIAWDGHRAVTRALSEAMPMLSTKALVTVVRVRSGALGQPLQGITVETALTRHGIVVDSRTVAPRDGQDVGQEILAQCSELGAGLLVMGAYEHSVFREELLGGTTNTILRNTEIPVLLAH